MTLETIIASSSVASFIAGIVGFYVGKRLEKLKSTEKENRLLRKVDDLNKDWQKKLVTSYEERDHYKNALLLSGGKLPLSRIVSVLDDSRGKIDGS